MTFTKRDVEEEKIKSVELTAPVNPVDQGRPIFSWLSVSNFSPVEKDMWCRGVKFDYEIVLLPGYVKPKSLDPYSLDSIWFKGEITEPTVVWDGDYLFKMFEIILECFDPKCEMSDFIKVRRVEDGSYMTDFRTREVLRSRPAFYLKSNPLSWERKVARRQHIREVMEYYEECIEKENRQKYYQIIDYYKTSLSESTFHPVRYRRTVARRTDLSKADYFTDPSRNRMALAGLQFGLALYEKERAKHSKWYESELEMNHKIEAGYFNSDAEIVQFKAVRRIPLTDEEGVLLDKLRNGKAAQGGLWSKVFGGKMQ